MAKTLRNLSVGQRQVIEDITNKPNLFLWFSAAVNKLKLIGAAQLKGLRVFLDHLYETRDRRLCADQIRYARVNIGVDFFDAEVAAFSFSWVCWNSKERLFGNRPKRSIIST